MTATILQPAAIVVFGGTGDLTRRKLIPAFYNLYLSKDMPKRFQIILIGRSADDEGIFKQHLLEGVNEFSRTGKAEKKTWEAFCKNIAYQQGDFFAEETYTTLRTTLDAFDKKNAERGSRMFYMAIAPDFIEPVTEHLYKYKLCPQAKHDRIVVEKPFGTDLKTAKALNQFLQQRFKEQQIFRIDHYLGKETVQNLMAFRFANFIFEPLWNRKYVDHIQISVAEKVTVGKRGAYYDHSGALKDMIQNHLLQLLCVTAMDCPGKYEAETIRDAKVKVIEQIRIYKKSEVEENVVRGQYREGKIDGKLQPGYLQEDSVPDRSHTETFIAAKLFIDNDRWKGVPFFLRTGKALPRQASVIVIQFKDSPHRIFKDDAVPNRLIISIQPEQEISLLFESKVPGVQMKLKAVEMDFTYKDSHSEASPEAYETLLLDVMEGDPTLFMRSDQVEAAWKAVMPIINAWGKGRQKKLHGYKAGTWGPTAATDLLKPYAKEWILLPEPKEEK